MRRARGDVLPHPDNLAYDAIADWKFVADACHNLLRHRSKDLRIVAWFTEARLALDGFPGLREGLDLLRNLTDSFWETLYPEIEDGDAETRLRVFEWLDARLAASVRLEAGANTKPSSAPAKSAAKIPPDAGDAMRQRAEELKLCVQSVEELGVVCQGKFGDAAPTFDSLRYTLRQSLVDSAVKMMEQALQTYPAAALSSNLLRGLGGNDNLEKLLEQIPTIGVRGTGACEVTKAPRQACCRPERAG